MSENCPKCGAEGHELEVDRGYFYACGSRWYPARGNFPEHFNESEDCLRRQLEQAKADNERLLAENAALNIALFHVENGLSHPDERVRKLIEAAQAAKENQT